MCIQWVSLAERTVDMLVEKAAKRLRLEVQQLVDEDERARPPVTSVPPAPSPTIREPTPTFGMGDLSFTLPACSNQLNPPSDDASVFSEMPEDWSVFPPRLFYVTRLLDRMTHPQIFFASLGNA